MSIVSPHHKYIDSNIKTISLESGSEWLLPADEQLKTFTANQNPSFFKVHKHLKF